MLAVLNNQISAVVQAVLNLPPANPQSAVTQEPTFKKLTQINAAAESEKRISSAMDKGIITEDEANKLKSISSPQLRYLATESINRTTVCKEYVEQYLTSLLSLELLNETKVKSILEQKDPFLQMQQLEELRYSIYAANNLALAKEGNTIKSEVVKSLQDCPNYQHRLRYHLTKEPAEAAECKLYAEEIIEEAKALTILSKSDLAIINAIESPQHKYDYLVKEISPRIKLHKDSERIVQIAGELGIITPQEIEWNNKFKDSSLKSIKAKYWKNDVEATLAADQTLKLALEYKLIDEKLYQEVKGKNFKERINESKEYRTDVQYAQLSEQILNFASELNLVSETESEKISQISTPKDRYSACENLQTLCGERMQAYITLYDAEMNSLINRATIEKLIESNDHQAILTEATKHSELNQKAKEIATALRFCFEYGLISETEMRAIKNEKDISERHEDAEKFIQYYQNKEQYKDLASTIARFVNR
ncbi:MAG: hypothetical protein KBC84_07225 [Proteobacteria bacterium]|nr:hypothetical protein [Pseudomonadota bacterium]